VHKSYDSVLPGWIEIGSGKIAGYPVDVTGLADGDTLVFNEDTQRFEFSKNLDNLEVDTITFNPNYVGTPTEVGTTYYDVDNQTISTVLPDGIVGQHFEETFIQIENKNNYNLVNGSPVWYDGTIGNSGLMKGAYKLADGNVPAVMFLGIATQTIAIDGTGKLTNLGKVRHIQTNGANYGETWVNGDIIYASPTTLGHLTNIKPQAPNLAIPVAVVISAHANNGSLYVRPTYPQNLVDLSDVNGTPLDTTGQIPVWDDTLKVFDFTSNINDFVALPETAKVKDILEFDGNKWIATTNDELSFYDINGVRVNSAILDADNLTLENGLIVGGNVTIEGVALTLKWGTKTSSNNQNDNKKRDTNY
jgi:phage gp45-like